MSSKPRYSVVIPVYNSAPIVQTTIAQTIQFFERRGSSYEIIAVNDGSTDGSWDVLRAIAGAHPCVTAVDLAANYGQHTATFCGLAATVGDFVVTLDDDLQQPPGEIARLIEKADQGHDLVCGRYRQASPLARRLGSWTIGLVDRWLFNKPEGFVFTSFRLMRRDVVERICRYRPSDPYLRGLLVLCATNQANVWVDHRPRTVGRSGYDAIKIARFVVRIWRTYRALKRGGLDSPEAAVEVREVVGLGGVSASGVRSPMRSGTWQSPDAEEAGQPSSAIRTARGER